MVTVIGLMLDLIGAVTIARGLFRPSMPLYPGWLRDPDTAASDQAYGVAGATLLAAGFVIQGVAALLNDQPTGTPEGIAAGTAALVAGSVLAWLIFGLVYIRRFPVELARDADPANADLAEDLPVYVRRGKGLRFWLFEPRDPRG